ncbi:MAG: SAM-dependent methyltransferase, partial [Bacteroidota bacterium]
LLNEYGKIIGLLFDRTFDKQGPPFGGCPCEYKPIFESSFIIKKMENCYNSIPERANTEVFINFEKK